MLYTRYMSQMSWGQVAPGMSIKSVTDEKNTKKVCRTSKLLMAIYKDTVFHIHVMKDIHNHTHLYLKFSLYSYKPNSYMDIVFKLDDIPSYLQYMYRYVEQYNKISESDDKLGYILQGPCLQSKEIFKLSYIYIADYHRMLKTNHEIIYDYDNSIILAEEILRPIYNKLLIGSK